MEYQKEEERGIVIVKDDYVQERKFLQEKQSLNDFKTSFNKVLNRKSKNNAEILLKEKELMALITEYVNKY